MKTCRISTKLFVSAAAVFLPGATIKLVPLHNIKRRERMLAGNSGSLGYERSSYESDK